MDAGRARPLQRKHGLGLPDGQRRREPQEARRAVRAVGPRHRPRAAQSQGPPRALPDQDGPGVPDLEGRREPLGQDPRRHVSPADHRGQHHPQHRRLLGRAGRLPHRRFAGPEGAGHGRDELPEYLQAYPRQGLRRAFSASSTARASPGSKARRRSSRPTAPPTTSEGGTTMDETERQRCDPQGFHQDGLGRLHGHARRGGRGIGRAVRRGRRRDPHRRHRLRRTRHGRGHRRRRSRARGSRSWPSTTRSRTASTSSLKDAQGEGPGRRQGHAGDLLHRIRRLQEAPGHQETSITSSPPPRPASGRIHLEACIEAGKNVFMEKPVAVDPVGVRSVIASSALAAKKGLAIVAGHAAPPPAEATSRP